MVNCETQAEIDDLWAKLTAGGKEVACGWVTDKFGVSWQIVPTILGKLMSDKDPAKAGRVVPGNDEDGEARHRRAEARARRGLVGRASARARSQPSRFAGEGDNRLAVSLPSPRCVLPSPRAAGRG